MNGQKKEENLGAQEIQWGKKEVQYGKEVTPQININGLI